MHKPEYLIQGACLCGQVKLEISAPPLLTIMCHCRDCQKMFSSAYSLTAKIRSDCFVITEGRPVIGGLHGSRKHHFCPHCMCCMFSQLEGQDDTVNVRSTVFEGLKSRVPFIELFLSEKLPWIEPFAEHRYDTIPVRDELDGLLIAYREWAGKTS